MIPPMGRPLLMIPFWSFRGQRHITRGTEPMFAVSMCAVNVLEVLSAHIGMRCLKQGSYRSRISKIVTTGKWWWQCIHNFWAACCLWFSLHATSDLVVFNWKLGLTLDITGWICLRTCQFWHFGVLRFCYYLFINSDASHHYTTTHVHDIHSSWSI